MTLGHAFWAFLKFELKCHFDLDLTLPLWSLGQGLSMDQIWSMWGQGFKSYGLGVKGLRVMALTLKWPQDDLMETSDDLRSTFWTILRFDLKWPFDLDLTLPWWPLGQGLSMDQIWSMWGQGLMSYGRDLEMTLDDLRSTFWAFLKFDLKWPLTPCDLQPTPSQPLTAVLRVGTTCGVNLVGMHQ